MANKVSTFLMFQGSAAQALDLYAGALADFRLTRMETYGPGEDGAEGTVKRAEFSIAGQNFICFDSPPVHAFTFTPAISIFLDCDTDAELDRLYGALSAGGEVLMPLDTYPFSRKFAWIADRFGVSWQLNLP